MAEGIFSVKTPVGPVKLNLGRFVFNHPERPYDYSFVSERSVRLHGNSYQVTLYLSLLRSEGGWSFAPSSDLHNEDVFGFPNDLFLHHTEKPTDRVNVSLHAEMGTLLMGALAEWLKKNETRVEQAWRAQVLGKRKRLKANITTRRQRIAALLQEIESLDGQVKQSNELLARGRT